MKFRAAALALIVGFSLTGLAQAKNPKRVNHRVSSTKVKPRKFKNPKFKQPKVKHPKHRT